MGNRAVISFEGNKTGIYLHWNGGPESVFAFLDAAKELGVRDPTQDCYGVARIAQAIGNWFGGSLSLGVDQVSSLDCDNGDNGQYIVGPGFAVKARKFNRDSLELTVADLRNGQKEKYEGIKAECLKVNKTIFDKS